MNRIALLALSLVAMASVVVPAEGAVRCTSGTTVFAEGGLRIFGTHFDNDDAYGFEDYACLGRARRPLHVSSDWQSGGTASNRTLVLAVSPDGRMVGALEMDDGEGGGSAWIGVMDLQSRRRVNHMGVGWFFGDGTPAIRVANDGTIVVSPPSEDLEFKRPGRRARSLTDGGVRDLASSGWTVYWTDGGAARMRTFDADMGRMVEPVWPDRRRDRCARLRGRVVAASGSVRVRVRDGRRFACRIGVAGRFAVGSPGDPLPRIVRNRWVLGQRSTGVTVFDSRTGAAVTKTAVPATQAELLYDGALAWTDADGRLVAQSPGGEPVELAASGATALAAARRAFYWTEAGTPRRYRP